MKAERPFDYTRKILYNDLKDSREFLKYLFDKTDSYSLWIIGLSIGGISIFANNIADVQKAIQPGALRPILLLLAFSVTAGVAYRALAIYYFVLLNNNVKGMLEAFSPENTMDTESILQGDETFDTLINLVQDNLGDLSYLKQNYLAGNEEQRNNLYNYVVNNYHRSVEFAKLDTEIVQEHIADTYSTFLGINKEKFLKKLSINNSVHFNWIKKIVVGLYIIYLLTFIGAIFGFIYNV